MSTQQKNGSNGTAEMKKDSNDKQVATVVTLPAKKEEEKEKTPKPEAAVKNEVLPIEDRIFKVQQLGDLVEKHATLVDTKKKLDSFKLSSDGNRDTLSIRDSKGKEFITTNSAVIADVVETLKKSVAEKIDAVGKQIVF
jgi:hypothetical protein